MASEEIWSAIEGYPEYAVSSFGRVISYKHGDAKLLKCTIRRDGYYVVNLCNNGIMRQALVHRLVANAFIPNPAQLPTVNHLDEDKSNNSVNNLEWSSIRDNLIYGTRIERMLEKLMNNGHYQKMAQKRKRPVVQYSLSGELLNTYESLTLAGIVFGKINGYANISHCCNGKIRTAYGYVWKYKEEASDSVL